MPIESPGKTVITQGVGAEGACAPQLLQFVSTLSTHPICICSFLPNFLAKQGHERALASRRSKGWIDGGRGRGDRESGWNEPESQERQRNDSLWTPRRPFHERKNVTGCFSSLRI